VTPFTTISATTDGPPVEANCSFPGECSSDIWYTYTATCSGEATVTTCEQLGGSADFDTTIVIYSGTCADLVEIACNGDDIDNECGTTQGGFHSTAYFDAQQGETYLIRVGGYEGDEEGNGELNVFCGNPSARPRR
jgi:hypothetical protein